MRDPLGNTIYSSFFQGDNINIALSNCQKGLYILTVYSGNKQYNERIIVK